MLKVPATFPHVGATCYFDSQTADSQDVVEKARIQRDNGDGTALISIDSHRFPREVASGNRTIPFAELRATENAGRVAPTAPRKRRRSGAR